MISRPSPIVKWGQRAYSDTEIQFLRKVWHNQSLPGKPPASLGHLGLRDSPDGAAIRAAIIQGVPRPILQRIIAPIDAVHPAPSDSDADAEWGGPPVRPGSSRPHPYPASVLPGPLAELAVHWAAVVGAPVCYAAGAMLGTIAAAARGTLAARISESWDEPLILWVALVGDPGTGKTPVLSRVLRPLQRAEDRHYAEWDAAYRAWEQSDADPASLPPPRRRWTIDDVTPEAVIALAAQYPLGLTLVTDELRTWFGGFGRYRHGGGGSERAFWLSAWSAASRSVDRKKDRREIRARLHLSIIGGAQPDLITGLRDPDGDDGMVDRFLIHAADADAPGHWDETRGPHPDEPRWDRLIETLAEWWAEPIAVPMDRDASEFFRAFMRECRDQSDGYHAKAPAHAARLALALAAARAGLDRQRPRVITPDDIRGGVTLTRWYGAAGARTLGHDASDSPLVRWVEQRAASGKHSFTRSDITSTLRRYRHDHDALADALAELEAYRMIRPDPHHRRRWVIHPTLVGGRAS